MIGFIQTKSFHCVWENSIELQNVSLRLILPDSRLSFSPWPSFLLTGWFRLPCIVWGRFSWRENSASLLVHKWALSILLKCNLLFFLISLHSNHYLYFCRIIPFTMNKLMLCQSINDSALIWKLFCCVLIIENMTCCS